jgi:hypothetical protein
MGAIFDKLLCSSLTMTNYFWAFMLFAICAIFLAYLKDSEDMWQYFMKVVWYLMMLIIGSGIIIESIRFTKTVMGSGCVA